MAHDLALDSLTEPELRRSRTSVKWSAYPDDVLPMFIAEMDFPVAPEIRAALLEQIERSDLGYVNHPGDLAHAFAEFAQDRWSWEVDPSVISLATDVSFAVKETLGYVLPKAGGRVALTTPVYPSFFQYLVDVEAECVEIPLIGEGADTRIDVESLARAFRGDDGDPVHALILSNPHNPHGIAHSRETLVELAQAAAETGAFIVSDEVHAPLTHRGATFTPFSPIAEEYGARSLSVFSASKGWNLAGTKCAHIYAPDATAGKDLRSFLKRRLGFSASILGVTANTAAFREAAGYVDAVVEQVAENAALLERLLAEHIPQARYTPPKTGYLAWIDLRDTNLGDRPGAQILTRAKVAVSEGVTFGEAGRGGIRLNIGCAPALIEEAVQRIAAIL